MIPDHPNQIHSFVQLNSQNLQLSLKKIVWYFFTAISLIESKKMVIFDGIVYRYMQLFGTVKGYFVKKKYNQENYTINK